MSGENSRWTRWITATSVAVLALVSIAFLVMWLVRPPVAPLPITVPVPIIEENAKFTLSMSDEHYAAWMPVDNGFTLPKPAPDERHKKKEPNKEYRTGVLVQLGQYFDYDGNTRAWLDGWEGVEIHGEDGVLDRFYREPGDDHYQEFDWIDIAAKKKDTAKPPIKRADAGHLFPDKNYPKNCGEVDMCADSLHPTDPVPRKCLCKKEPCNEPANIANIKRPCARLRSIRAHHNAEKIITYWGGDSGYRVVANVRGDNNHSGFRFWGMEDVTVTVYKGNQPVRKFDAGTVRRVTVVGHHDHDKPTYHGEAHEPPLGLGP